MTNMPVYRLDEDLWFPDPHEADDELGLVAVGGDLSPQRLLLAYSHGFFPWFAYKTSRYPHWYCPLRRFVIFPEEIHISHSMRTLINSGRYECTFNQAFADVIRRCASVDGRERERGAWIGPDIIAAYTEMHRLGYAMSVEVWETASETQSEPQPGRRLVGGLYGMQVGRGFYGESMFSLAPSASKLALIFLAKICSEVGISLIDCQYETPHLLSMGGRHIPYEEYMSLISLPETDSAI